MRPIHLRVLGVALCAASVLMAACAVSYEARTGTATAGWAVSGQDLGKAVALTEKEVADRVAADATLRQEVQEADKALADALAQMQRDIAAGTDPAPALAQFRADLSAAQTKAIAEAREESKRQLDALSGTIRELESDLAGKEALLWGAIGLGAVGGGVGLTGRRKTSVTVQPKA